MGTAIVLIILIAVVVLIVNGMIKDKKAGKNLCTHDCTSCGSHGTCHKLDDLKRDLNRAKESL